MYSSEHIRDQVWEFGEACFTENAAHLESGNHRCISDCSVLASHCPLQTIAWLKKLNVHLNYRVEL